MTITLTVEISNKEIKNFAQLVKEIYSISLGIGRQLLKTALEKLDDELLAGRDAQRYRCKGFQKTCIKTLLGAVEYKSIIFRRVMYVGLQRHHYKALCLVMSGAKIAESLKASKSGVNDFLRAFRDCPALSYPLPEGITNYGIAALVYGEKAATSSRDPSYEMPDYEAVEKDMSSRKNMTLVVLWNRYAKRCRDCGLKFYSYRQFCENYAKWCEENKETLGNCSA